MNETTQNNEENIESPEADTLEKSIEDERVTAQQLLRESNDGVGFVKYGEEENE